MDVTYRLSRPDHPSAGIFCLLSHHGTILCADADTGKLRLRTVDRETTGEDVRVAASDPGRTDDPGYRIVGDRGDALSVVVLSRTAAGRHVVGLLKDGTYVTSTDDFRVHNRENWCRAWETYLLVREKEVAFVTSILSSRCLLVSRAGESCDSRRCGFGPGFTLRLAEKRVALAEVADLCDVLEAFDLVQRSSDDGIRGAYRLNVSRPASAHKIAPKIRITPLGNTANRALQYLVAETIRSRVDGATIHGARLPEWSIASDEIPLSGRIWARLGFDDLNFDLPGMVDCLNRGVIDTLWIDTYPFNLSFYPSLERSREVLHRAPREAEGFGAGDLVCSVRGGEVLYGLHKDYLVLPPRYYEALRERSGLDLVFYGQLGDDPYTQSLRSRFPDARFVPGRSPAYDFAVLRASKNIALSVSTFAWLAAWLGEADAIYLPIAGMFSPVQHPDTSFLPALDPRFHYTLLPYANMVNVYKEPDAFARMQARLGDGMEPMSGPEVRDLCARAARFRRPIAPLSGFDDGYYLSRYPEVAELFYGGQVASPLQHYIESGFKAGCSPRMFDEDDYLRRWPEAATEIARGLFANPLQHAMAQGRV